MKIKILFLRAMISSIKFNITKLYFQLPFTNPKKKEWHIYYMVQPYFFSHHHFHLKKIKELRLKGFNAWILAFIPELLYLENKLSYEEIQKEGYTKIVLVDNESKINRRVIQFLIKEFMLSKGVLLHVLRTDPDPIIRIRKWPIIGNKIKFILEMEGDLPSELVYQCAYIEKPGPPHQPTPELQNTYDNALEQVKYQVKEADGLVLMSQEQTELWENRLGRSLNACCLPTLADSSLIQFRLDQRIKVRSNLGLNDRIVLVYTGNVNCKWQRLDAMCEFVAKLRSIIPNIWFLLLVHIDDLPMAYESICRNGLEQHSTVQNVSSEEIPNYLSAADLALFLRHIHPMNLVVTSGKLGEFLAAGLPVITTGANAEILNIFIKEMQAGLFLHDSLTINEEFLIKLKSLIHLSGQFGWRTNLSQKTAEIFGGKNDPFQNYVPFIKDILKQH